MGKLFKVIAWLLGAVIVVAVAAVVAVAVFFDPNDYKPQIAELVRDRTGRELSIDGTIGLSFFPWLGVEVNRLTLSNAEGFGDEPFAAIERADVKLKPLPLLSRSLEMDTVVLHGLRLNLARSAQGSGNWELVAKADIPADELAQPESTASENAAGSGFPLTDIAIDGIELRDARVSWTDHTQADARAVTLDALNVHTGPVRLDQPVDVTLDAKLAAPASELAATVNLSTALGLDFSAQTYRAEALTLTAELSGAAVPGGVQPATLAGNVVFDAAQNTLDVNDLKLALETLGVALSGRLAGSNLAELPSINGAFQLAELSPRRLLQALDQALPATADSGVLHAASGELTFSATPQQLDIGQLRLALDDTLITGTATVSLPNVAAAFDLSIDDLDLDRYLPPRAAGAPPPVETPGSATAETAAAGKLELEPLRGLDLRGTVAIAKLKVNELRLSQITLPLTARDGRINLQPEAQLYDGRYAGNIGIDATGELPLISVDEKLDGVQAGPLLQDLTGEARVSGKATGSVKLTLRGADPEQIKRSLNGDARFAFSDGAVKGINIGQLLRQAKAALKNPTLIGSQGMAAAGANGDQPLQTDFAELSATVQFANGIASNDDLAAKSPLLRVSGQGSANLIDDTLDYRLTVTLVDTSKGQGGKELDELRGIPIPIKISGNLQDPAIALDLAGILQQQTEQALQKEADKLVDKAQEKLKQKLGDTLDEQTGDALKEKAGELLKGLFD